MDEAIEAAEAEMVEWFNAMKIAGGWFDPDGRAVIVAYLRVLLDHPGYKKAAVPLLTALGE